MKNLEFKGTKGVWEYDNDCVSSSDMSITSNIVCESPISYIGSMANWESNAKLIAAAPTMLYVIQSMIQVFDHCVMPTEQHLKNYSTELKAVIKKALE